MRHTISILVENKFGVLTRVAGLFSGRGYNIDTLNVGPTHNPTISRMTIVTRGDDATVEQIVKQLNKLVDVLTVLDFRDGEYVDRELVLVKVKVDSKYRAEVMQIGFHATSNTRGSTKIMRLNVQVRRVSPVCRSAVFERYMRWPIAITGPLSLTGPSPVSPNRLAPLLTRTSRSQPLT